MPTATVLPPPGAPSTYPPPLTPAIGQPLYALAEHLFPRQGDWTLKQYHDLLAQDEDLRVEFADGCLEFLPVPTDFHEELVVVLVAQLYAVLGRRRVRSGGYELVTPDGNGRFPDVLASNDRAGFGPQRTTAADLVIEIVSPGGESRERDFVTKRRDYAAAGVSEYWVIDPEASTLLQLRLDGEAYAEVGTYGVGQTVVCGVIGGFSVDLANLFDASAND